MHYLLFDHTVVVLQRLTLGYHVLDDAVRRSFVPSVVGRLGTEPG